MLAFLCRSSSEPESCVQLTENKFMRHGLKSLLIVKFIPGLSTVTAPLAGVSGDSFVSFIHFDLWGIVIWSGSYMGLGFIFSDQLEMVADCIARMSTGFLVLIAGIVIAWLLGKFIQRRRLSTHIALTKTRHPLQAGEDLRIADLPQA
jgi:membrane protein DedA with SNARE-associated domain